MLPGATTAPRLCVAFVDAFELARERIETLG